MGQIYRSFKDVGTSCLTYLYMTLVRPVLEYCACVWDPITNKNTRSLERVQEFAAKVATGRWSEHGWCVVASEDWPILTKRRQYLKICLCRKILEGISIIPSNVFTPAPTTCVRHTNSRQLIRPLACTRSYYGSYFVSVTKLWNDQPNYISNCKL